MRRGRRREGEERGRRGERKKEMERESGLRRDGMRREWGDRHRDRAREGGEGKINIGKGGKGMRWRGGGERRRERSTS